MRTKLPEKLYYGIGEVAEAFDVNPSLIRFWEKEFKQVKPKIINRRRYYSIEQIELKDQVSVGGKVFATAKFLIDNLYDLAQQPYVCMIFVYIY